MALDTVKQIISDIDKGIFHPIYFLMGEEPYYIDRVSKYIEDHALTEAERGFNQMVFYGRDVTIEDIVAQAKRYPMMAERQVVIVKEAQDLVRTIDALQAYVENPQPTTVLVFCYKYKKLDARKKITKTLKKNAFVFESKKIYENQIATWIQSLCHSKGHEISPKAAYMLAEFLGNDLSKISNEVTKLSQVLGKGVAFTPEAIEQNIGISKDFNNFELQSAIAQGNYKKAYCITQYFSQNQKSHPLVLTIGLLYSFFSKVLKYHSLTNKSEAPKVLGVSPYHLKDYQDAARYFPMKKVSAIITTLREVDLKSKGVGGASITEGDLLKELLVGIFK